MEAKKRVNIAKKYHRYILGKRGLRWKELEIATSTKIQVPSLSDQSETIVITGSQERIRNAEAELKLICDEMDSRVTIMCLIEKKYRSRVLGPKGCNVRAIREKFSVHIQFPDRLAEEDIEEVETVQTIPIYDEVIIGGQRDNAEAARKALLNLVPITIQVDVPHNLHHLLIGRRGCEVRELKEKYDVHILMSRPDEELDYIKISGTPRCVEEARIGILEKCEILKADLRDKALKAFELKIEVGSEYFSTIIGHEGVTIKKIISDNDVAINFPRTGDPEQNIITITGYGKNTHNARDDILKLISELKPKNNVIFGQFVPKTQDKPVISPCESTSSSIHETDNSCEAYNVQDNSEELLLNGEFDSEDEDKSEEEEVSSEIQDLDKNFNTSWTSKFDLDKSMSIIRQHADLVTKALKSKEYSQKHLTEMYTNVTSKQEKKILDLRKQLNDEVSSNKALKSEHMKLILEVENERKEREKNVIENEKKNAEETKKLSDKIKELEKKLNSEREEKSKLVAENKESLKRNETLVLKHSKLEMTHQTMKEDFQSSVTVLREKEKTLSSMLDEIRNTQFQTLEKDNIKLEDYRQRLVDLGVEFQKAISQLKSLTLQNAKLVEAEVINAKEISELKTVLREKDDEIQSIKTDLSKILMNNDQLSKTIESLNKELVIKAEELCQIETEYKNEELVTKAKEICQIKTEYKSFKANVDKYVLREKANHEAKFDKIKSNVSDLKEKLAEITNNIYNSADVCEMLNGNKNTSGIQSDESVDTPLWWRRE